MKSRKALPGCRITGVRRNNRAISSPISSRMMKIKKDQDRMSRPIQFSGAMRRTKTWKYSAPQTMMRMVPKVIR